MSGVWELSIPSVLHVAGLRVVKSKMKINIEIFPHYSIFMQSKTIKCEICFNILIY